MAAYRVDISPAAQRDLARLPPPLLARLIVAVEELAVDPRPVGAEKLAALEAYRRRVGDYRIIYEVDDRARSVILIRVRHRREAYRRLR